MTPAELVTHIAQVETDVNRWSTRADEWGRDEIADAVEAWDRLDRLITNLTILRHDYGTTLARRLPDEYTAATRGGAVTVHRSVSANHHWNGHDLIEALAEPMVDTTTGEHVQAIPVTVARAVIPACGQGQTSSKWKITEVRKRVEADKYHNVDYGDATIARGPLAYQARNTRSPAEPPASPTVTHT